MNSSEATVERVIDVAIEEFSRAGYAETKLDTISKISGMSKRMIHYHFTDKQGLYQQALATAAQRLNPRSEDLEISSSVPVEGVRQLVDRLFAQHVAHPEAVRMLTAEASNKTLGSGGHQAVLDISAIMLHLDRLLLAGQDAGAFRPGISANDIFTLIAALAMYRVSNRTIMEALLGVDMCSEMNTAGLHRMAVDAVLSFLTANIPATGHQSYLVAKPASEDESEATSDDIYGEEA